VRSAGSMFDEDDISKWQATLDVDLRAVLVGVHLAARAMIHANMPGTIISVASAAGVFALHDAPVYCAAKGGLVHFTRSAARALSEHGVRLATVCPQFVDTPLVANASEKLRAYISEKLGALLRPSAVVNEIVKLVDAAGRSGVATVILQNGNTFDWEPVLPVASSSTLNKQSAVPAGQRRPVLASAASTTTTKPQPLPVVSLPSTYRRWEVQQLSREFEQAAVLVSAPMPELLPTGHVLIQRVVTGVNASDINFTSGAYASSKAAAYSALPFVAGFESAGIVMRAPPDSSVSSRSFCRLVLCPPLAALSLLRLSAWLGSRSSIDSFLGPLSRPNIEVEYIVDLSPTTGCTSTGAYNGCKPWRAHTMSKVTLCAGFCVGQAVAALSYGGFSEYAVEKEEACLPIPAATAEAVACMTSGLTASIALEEAGLFPRCGQSVSRAKTVLVTAAAGGTGMFAVQLAQLAGCHVIGTCGGDAKVALLCKLGVHRVVNYRQENLAEVRLSSCAASLLLAVSVAQAVCFCGKSLPVA
jgi:D-arabinose 1-dehydrogenase-like Zn-dependent alcohol dehydrogenase